MNYGILGAGEMGLALASVLLNNNQNVLIYCRNHAKSQYLNENHQSLDKLPGIYLNENLVSTSSLEEVVKKSDILVIAVPSKEIKNLILEVNKCLDHKVIIVNSAKGFDATLKSGMQQLILDVINKDYLDGIVSILGPGFAKEIITKHITLVCAVSKDLEKAKIIQQDFSNEYFRVYLLNDVIGAEIGSALKNVIAIASGILAGLGYGEDSKAAIITRGLIEIRKIGKLYNANDETFLGLTGVGDLVLTCNSLSSRNYAFGYNIGLKNDAKKVLEENTSTIEGYYTLKAIKRISDEYNLDLPIIDGLYKVIYEFQTPSIVTKEIMNRPLKSENIKLSS